MIEFLELALYHSTILIQASLLISIAHQKVSKVYYSFLQKKGVPLNLAVILKNSLTLFDMGFFEPSVIGGEGGMRAPHHNFVVIVPMIMKFGTCVKPDVFYTMVTKTFVTSLLLRHYDVITCILANA